jgi:hypothetical protein
MKLHSVDIQYDSIPSDDYLVKIRTKITRVEKQISKTITFVNNEIELKNKLLANSRLNNNEAQTLKLQSAHKAASQGKAVLINTYHELANLKRMEASGLEHFASSLANSALFPITGSGTSTKQLNTNE